MLLCISFASVYGLSVAQKNNYQNRYISILISLVISIVNVLLMCTYLVILDMIRILTKYERDYTESKHQTTLAIKSIFAQLVNSIATPILVNRFI